MKEVSLSGDRMKTQTLNRCFANISTVYVVIHDALLIQLGSLGDPRLLTSQYLRGLR